MSSVMTACPTSISLNIFFFFFNDTATTEIYTLSLHDALPIYYSGRVVNAQTGQPVSNARVNVLDPVTRRPLKDVDRKSTRLNSSHDQISYAVFCLKKKKVIAQQLYSPSHQCQTLTQSRADV